jgi:hypothetical protein
MKNLEARKFFFEGEEAQTVDVVLDAYRALGCEVFVYLYHSRYWQEDCSPRGIVITNWEDLGYLTVDCYTNTL